MEARGCDRKAANQNAPTILSSPLRLDQVNRSVGDVAGPQSKLVLACLNRDLRRRALAQHGGEGEVGG